MPLEFLVQELPDLFSVPPFGMIKIDIKGEVSIVKMFRFNGPVSFPIIDRAG